MQFRWNNGNIGFTQLITWGISILTLAGSMTYASFSANNNEIKGLGVKQAGTEATVVSIDKRLERIELKLDSIMELKK